MYCPHFPKAQRESWFVIVADESTRELLLLSRASPKMVGRKGKITCTLDIDDEVAGRDVTVLCINDAMDIQYSKKYTLK